MNTSLPHGARVYVGNDSPYVGPFDPDHSTPATTSKLYGNACIASSDSSACEAPAMDGFVEWAVAKRGRSVSDASSLLNAFTPERVPVMAALAEEFALFDRFFCSHPGPTWPNRLFQLMATSQGCTETSVWDPKTLLFAGRTVFDQVEEAGHDWRLCVPR